MPDLPAGSAPDVDSRHDAAPSLSQRGFPAPRPAPERPGIGLPWLGLPADDYRPDGGADGEHPHLFHLQSAGGNFFDGGSLQGAHSRNWPILVEQRAAVYLARLEPGGIREPHWHPSAWELNYVIAGRIRWSFVGPSSTQDVFEAGAGDLIMAPQGHYHYFENASEHDDLIVLIVFNADTTEPEDDVALAQSISATPAAVLAAVFGVDESAFADLPVIGERRTIVRRPSTASDRGGKA